MEAPTLAEPELVVQSPLADFTLETLTVFFLMLNVFLVLVPLQVYTRSSLIKLLMQAIGLDAALNVAILVAVGVGATALFSARRLASPQRGDARGAPRHLVDRWVARLWSPINLTGAIAATLTLLVAATVIVFVEVVLDHAVGLPMLVRQLILAIGFGAATVFIAL
jgi:hypothetical protein